MRNLLILCYFMIGCVPVFAQQSPEQVIQKFFSDYETLSPAKTLDNLYTHMPWVEKIRADIDKLKTQFASLPQYFGKYHGSVPIARKDIGGGTFVGYSYLAKFESQPVRFVFRFYKPRDIYYLYSFSYDMQLEEEMDNSMKIPNLK